MSGTAPTGWTRPGRNPAISRENRNSTATSSSSGQRRPAPNGCGETGSAAAAYWHSWARELPLPPPPSTAEEIAEAEQLAEWDARERMERLDDDMFCGGVRPIERIRTLAANSYTLVRVDRPLLDALAEAEPECCGPSPAGPPARLPTLLACQLWSGWVRPWQPSNEARRCHRPSTTWAQGWERLLGSDSAVRNVHVRVENANDLEFPRASTRGRRRCRRSSPPPLESRALSRDGSVNCPYPRTDPSARTAPRRRLCAFRTIRRVRIFRGRCVPELAIDV